MNTTLQQTPVPPVQTNQQHDAAPHTDIRGRMNRYTSAYWVLAMPALGARYVIEFFFRLADAAKKHSNAIAEGVSDYSKAKGLESSILRVSDLLIGLYMYGITAFYAKRTYSDIRSVFSETLGHEFNKKAEDINLLDLWKSRNTAVHTAMRNFRNYTMRRAVVNLGFFVPYFLSKFSKKMEVDPFDSAKLGVGLNMGYLTLDAVVRKETFFEALQTFIDLKINQFERVGEKITATDLANLYERYARENKEINLTGRMNSPLWKQSMPVFDRIAELMNRSYGLENSDNADFTIPKLIYLLGEGNFDLKQPEKLLAYVEAANKRGREGFKAVDALRKLFDNGVPVKQAMLQLGIPQGPKSDQQPSSEAGMRPDEAADIQKEKATTGERKGFQELTTPPASYQEHEANRANEPGTLVTR